MKLFQLRMIPEFIIEDAPNYQDVWDLAAKPSTIHRTKSEAKAKAAKLLAEFTDYFDEECAGIEWEGNAGAFESITGTVTFLITQTTIR